MKYLFVLLSCYFLISLVAAVNGVDLFVATSISTFTCLKNSGNSFAIIRAFRSSGILDTNANTNLQNAKAAGLAPDVYMFPCRGKDPLAQVNTMFNGVSGNLFSTVWIDVETNPSSGCSWKGYSAADNCAFLTSLIEGIAKFGKAPGIYSSYYQWQGIFGSTSACSSVSKVPLWYAHYDNVQAFSDFKPFAGWTKPYMKQYQGDVTVCSTDVDKNWRP